ncbi:MAG: glycine cleavage T C-terminal barrel domain-containing protein [Oscillochloridaceae bacterium]|nr:glycine cleavage system protein T [Chloroflexaceae bacterium]MDW8391056.1 glycine cleavage T C-terminal barrel domain-containing protein [Oscillochloridaceae bacterium]
MTDTRVSRARPDAYAAAYEGAALYDSSARGRIWMRDRDRAALLHRLSTNHIERLKPGEGTETVLTTPIGRIIDLLDVYCLEEALLLVASPGQGATILGYLRKNIFFNDRVKVEDAGAALGELTLYGPRAAVLLADLGIVAAAELPARGIATAAWQDAPLYVAGAAPIGASGYRLIASPSTLERLGPALREAGAVRLDAPTYDVLRVEHGYGAFGRELSQEYIPLEAGLWSAVSFNKGCYVGQEIIARMESRGRLAKQLRGLRFAALPELPAEAAMPLARLDAEGKEAGDLTSLVESPRYGLIGLGYVRTAHAAPGTVLHVASACVEVVELPFGDVGAPRDA